MIAPPPPRSEAGERENLVQRKSVSFLSETNTKKGLRVKKPPPMLL